jgi:hypothetical protein
MFTPDSSKLQGHDRSRAPSKASTLAPSDSVSATGLKDYKKRAARLEQEPQEKEQTAAAPLWESLWSQGKPVPNPISRKAPAVRSASPRRQISREDLEPRMGPQRNGRGRDLIDHVNGHQHHDHEEHSSTHSRFDEELDRDEEETVGTILSRASRSSMAPSTIGSDVQISHFYDMELCELLHSLEAKNLPEIAKKAVRKAVRARVKKLGMKSDNEVGG